MGALQCLEAKGLNVLFNSMWRLKKPWEEFATGTVFYVDDETDNGALILHPIAPVGHFIDRAMIAKSNQFLARFDTSREVDPDEVPPNAKLDDITVGSIAALDSVAKAVRADDEGTGQ